MKVDKKIIDFIRCPVCKTDKLNSKDNSIICVNNHCFDISSKGYVNFILNQVKNRYTKQTFISRNTIFNMGFYDNVLKELEDIIIKYIDCKSKMSILDIGCGEGFYTKRLSEDIDKSDIFALDISKEAIKIATSNCKDVFYMVADLANIPIKDKSMDILINILTPANYEEFNRVLKDEGIVIKIIPGREYLMQIRNASKKLRSKNYSNDDVINHMKNNLNVLETRNVKYTVNLDDNTRNLFIQMTPMTFYTDVSDIDIEMIDSITIDLDIIVCKKQGI